MVNKRAYEKDGTVPIAMAVLFTSSARCGCSQTASSGYRHGRILFAERNHGNAVAQNDRSSGHDE